MVREKSVRFLALWAVLALAAGACNFPTAKNLGGQASAIHTQAAATIAVQLTQTSVAAATAVPQQPSALPPVPVLPPAYPASPQFPPAGPQHGPRPTPCNWALFISDISIPDGSFVLGGSAFTKTWRVKNIGACTWNSAYALVFVSGERMGGEWAYSLPYSVSPGDWVDLSVNLVAPSGLGSYRGYWQLRDDQGNLFGLDASAREPFWVDIRVGQLAGPYSTPFDLEQNACSALWSNSSGYLPCPGTSASQSGYVIRIANPVIERGQDDEPGLWVHPEFLQNGIISGQYPPIRVQEGNHFISTLACMGDRPNCNVLFTIFYSADGGPVTKLGSWAEASEGLVTFVDVDLSFLAGQDVVFILTVGANGSYKGDDAIWMVPAIR